MSTQGENPLGPTAHTSYNRCLPMQKLLGERSVTAEFDKATNSLCLNGTKVWRSPPLPSYVLRPPERRFPSYTRGSTSWGWPLEQYQVIQGTQETSTRRSFTLWRSISSIGGVRPSQRNQSENQLVCQGWAHGLISSKGCKWPMTILGAGSRSHVRRPWW